jgi:hypothetical protein
MTTVSDDDALIQRGGSLRSATLANIYGENATHATCTCSPRQHDDASNDCPRAIWNQAARIARLMVED